MKENVWGWEFQSVGQLREALERYHVDSADVARYDRGGGRGHEPPGDLYRPDKCFRAYQKNMAIDRAMSRLALIDKRIAYPLLHAWYRRGYWADDSSWSDVAKWARISKQVGGRIPRPVFDLLVLQATELLFFAHHAQRGPKE